MFLFGVCSIISVYVSKDVEKVVVSFEVLIFKVLEWVYVFLEIWVCEICSIDFNFFDFCVWEANINGVHGGKVSRVRSELW